MEKRKLKKQNANEIKREFLKFLAHLTVLSALSFFVIYFFFKSYSSQREKIHQDVIAYKEVLNKHQLLKSRIDTIYYQMTLLNTGQVRNDVFLGNYISGNIQDVRKIISNDSASEFKHYAYLVTRLDSLLFLKNDITSIANKEQLAFKDLTECMGKIAKAKNELSKDPTRGVFK